MKKIFLVCLAAITVVCTSVTIQSEVIVIVNTENTSTINKDMINKIFLGKVQSFSNGNDVKPIALKPGSDATEEFNTVVLKKRSTQLKTYWSKLVFTGKGTPPKEVETDEMVINIIKSTPNAIGFVSSDKDTGGVRIVERFSK